MDPVIWGAVIGALATIAAAIIGTWKVKQRSEKEITPPIVLGSPRRREAKPEFMSDQRMLELATNLQMQAEEGDFVELIDRKQGQD